MEIEQVYEIVDKIKIEIKENINEGLNTHFKYIDEKLDAIIDCADKNEDAINKMKQENFTTTIKIRELEFRMEKIETAQKQSDSKITTLKEFFEKKMVELKDLVTPRKMSWPKIISIVLSILASPAVLLLVQSILKAKGWL
jgi:hypothetical protein